MKQQNGWTGYITKTLVAPLALAAALGASFAVNADTGTPTPSPVDPSLQSAQDALLNTLATLDPGTPQYTAVAMALQDLTAGSTLPALIKSGQLDRVKSDVLKEGKGGMPKAISPINH